jgi:hypothetical protein
MATRRSTRTANANQHPGEIVNQQKQKRRTKEEMARDNKAAQERKDAIARQKQTSMNQVAMVELQIQKDDQADHTIPPRRGWPLRRTSSHALIQLDGCRSDEDSNSRSSETTPKADGGKRYPDDWVPTDIEDEPPKKKSKAAKANTRATIIASRNTLARNDTVRIAVEQEERQC